MPKDVRNGCKMFQEDQVESVVSVSDTSKRNDAESFPAELRNCDFSFETMEKLHGDQKIEVTTKVIVYYLF
jgi:plastocyanin domain-containing protein